MPTSPLTHKPVTTQLRKSLARAETNWQQYHLFRPIPTVGEHVGVLAHHLPPTVPVDQFIQGHLARVLQQDRLSRAVPKQPALRTLRMPVAAPILCGFDPTRGRRGAFVVVCAWTPKSTPLRATLTHPQVAAVERACAMIWAYGAEFDTVARSTITMTPALDVTLFDFSRIVNTPQWKSQQFATAGPGDLETMYVDSIAGDAALLRQLSGKLPPTGKDRLLAHARSRLWSSSSSSSQ